MAIATPDRSITIACTASGPDLPSGFAAEFCVVLREELARNRPASDRSADIVVTLERAGEFSLNATVTVRQSEGAEFSQDFSLSVRDSSLQPSIAKTLVFSVLQLLK